MGHKPDMSETASANVSRRGRPVVLDTAERREHILTALEHVYQQHGLAGSTMDAIAKQAGMSKRTLYTIFPDRMTLLQAYLKRLTANFGQPLDSHEQALPLADRLRLLVMPRVCAGHALPLDILRVIIAETSVNPEVGRAFGREMSDRKRNLVMAELDRAQADGELSFPDSAAAAELFIDMVKPRFLDVLLDRDLLPSDTELESRFDLAVAVFTRAFRPGGDTG
ncbi:TetR/AcrR family transcriptional regulator [Actibacterium ureilyticum]|uniref:TetR/AcrR family transcriptional regulator n=1 Tax=Actibacterium ureilyticum TaxID=1590614 RepID=UPI000BAAED34|nr:TetR/AcrR family transcriptional regulator [Actibacterium ureilyticum]